MHLKDFKQNQRREQKENQTILTSPSCYSFCPDTIKCLHSIKEHEEYVKVVLI